MAKLLQYFIKAYSFLVSPFLGRNCRFTPTCSAYAHQALEKHGFLKGVYLIFFRIICCHPWNNRDFDDPVPERFAWKEILGYKRCTCVKEADLSGTENKIIEGSNNESQ